MRLYDISKPKDYLPQRILIEIWEVGNPGILYGLNLNEKRLLSKNNVRDVLEGWKEVAGRLSNPMITIQANINEGVYVAYENKIGEKDVPLICNSFTIKYAFDDSVRPLHMSYNNIEEMPGHSVVFHSHFNSETLEKELEKLVEIVNDFFDKEGAISKDYQKYFKKMNFFGEELRIDNEKLLIKICLWKSLTTDLLNFCHNAYVATKKLKIVAGSKFMRIFNNKYVVILGERIYEKDTPLVYWIATQKPQDLSERIKIIARERDISYREAIQQHEYFGQRIGG